LRCIARWKSRLENIKNSLTLVTILDFPVMRDVAHRKDPMVIDVAFNTPLNAHAMRGSNQRYA
jgi:hypothetical protein